MPLAEGAETVPGGLPARLAHLQGPRMLGAGVAHACPPRDVGATTDNKNVNKKNVNVATDSDEARRTSFPVAPGTPPTTLRANAHVLRAPGGSLLMGPWHGAFARADEARGGRAHTREGERRRPRSPEDESDESSYESARRATERPRLKDRPAIDAAHAEHIAELAFCGVDEMRLDEGRAVSLELVAEDAVAGRISRSDEIEAFAFPRRHRVRSAPAAPTRKVGAQRVATRRRPSASFVRARREDARSKEGETRARGHGDVHVRRRRALDVGARHDAVLAARRARAAARDLCDVAPRRQRPRSRVVLL